jgi:chromosome segregation ATPase
VRWGSVHGLGRWKASLVQELVQSLATELQTLAMMEEETAADVGLETAIEVEEQLQSAVKLATQLKQENSLLSRELEDAREFSRNNAVRNSEMRECWKRELEMVEKREKELKEEEAKWKQRIESKKSELEALEKKFFAQSENSLPHGNADQLKLLENEYNTKLNRLEEEVRSCIHSLCHSASP